MAERKKEVSSAEDLDLLPVMNLFSILIPFLISVAVFQKLGIVEVYLPERSDIPVDMDEPPPPDDQAINLTVAITPEYLQIVARGGMLPMVFYKEMWTYRCKNEDTVTYSIDDAMKTEGEVDCPDGSKADRYDIETINLWNVIRTSEEDPGTLQTALYNENDSAFLDGNGEFIPDKKGITEGTVLATLSESSARKLTGEMISKSKTLPRSAYDELAKTLIGIHNRFIDAPDAENIIVLADDKIAFDKVINVMDRSRDAGFWKISLAKLGG
jgi:biopolymer transport protein ExbD